MSNSLIAVEASQDAVAHEQRHVRRQQYHQKRDKNLAFSGEGPSRAIIYFQSPVTRVFRTKQTAILDLLATCRHLKPDNLRTRGFYGGETEVGRLLGCSAVQSDNKSTNVSKVFTAAIITATMIQRASLAVACAEPKRSSQNIHEIILFRVQYRCTNTPTRRFSSRILRKQLLTFYSVGLVP